MSYGLQLMHACHSFPRWEAYYLKLFLQSELSRSACVMQF